jgi:hypothetical protein
MYHGLRLFQFSPLDSHQEGEKVTCDLVELSFSSKEARGTRYPNIILSNDLRLLFLPDDLSQYLEVRYNRTHIPANV